MQIALLVKHTAPVGQMQGFCMKKSSGQIPHPSHPRHGSLRSPTCLLHCTTKQPDKKAGPPHKNLCSGPKPVLYITILRCLQKHFVRERRKCFCALEFLGTRSPQCGLQARQGLFQGRSGVLFELLCFLPCIQRIDPGHGIVGIEFHFFRRRTPFSSVSQSKDSICFM